jgi:predicted RNase H-like nuclease (RuvC/YqgF family)
MAQDFREAFDIGPSDRHINPLDASGVSLAAIQALDENVRSLEERNRALEGTIERLERRLAEIEREGAPSCDP